MVEVQQRYEASEAMAPFDFHARASASARLACETPVMDLRLRQSSLGLGWPSSPMLTDVSIRDLLGASLVTYDQHLDISDLPTAAASSPYQDLPPAIEPKAVYVQYQSQDPVTGRVSPVVVPASLSLDVFADRNWFGGQHEEERMWEEATGDNDDEDRQKLKSSSKGDPILMRAKPAPPPDPYFSPSRHENFMSRRQESGAVGRSAWNCSPALGQAQGRGDRDCGAVRSRHVEGIGTMSSFLKASGKDKYSRSRIAEIDQILKSPSYRDSVASGEQRLSSLGQAELAAPFRPTRNTHSGNGRKGCGSLRPRRLQFTSSVDAPSPSDSSTLAAQMAMYIQRMPQFHKEKLERFSNVAFHSVEIDACDIGDVGNTGGAIMTNVEEGENGRGSPGSQAPPELPTLPSATQQQAGELDAESPCQSSSKRGFQAEGRCRVPGARSLSKKLRDLDPHIDISESVPTQLLHSNWPDGLRRQLARHFYGLSPAQILEEEDKDRARERRAVRGKDAIVEVYGETTTDDGVVDETRAAKAKSRREAQRRGLERSFARADDGVMHHRLEVRIRNIARSDRVVVGVTTGPGESTSRPCTILDELHARKYLAY